MSDAKLTDFTPDPANANTGTERGVYMVDKSIEQNGAGRSILVTSDNVVIAGNKTQQAALDAGLEDAVVVETDGSKLVVVKRTDLKSGTPEAYNMALADNRASEVGLQWDADIITALQDEIDLSAWFREDELEAVLAEAALPDDFPAYDEDIADEVEMITCPHCGKEFPK